MFAQAIALNIFLMLKCYTRGVINKKSKMFKKIVSNLPFSPALVGQLGFYAKRLRKEEATRRLALIFVILTLIVQSLAVFQPPTSANASSQNDMVNGGINSIDNYLSSYDSNIRNLKDVMNYVGITRSEIASAQYSSWTVGQKASWGFVSHFSYTEGERQYNVYDNSGNQITTVYSRPLRLWYDSNAKINGWIGESKTIGWFAIMQECGNLVTEPMPNPKTTPTTVPTTTETPIITPILPQKCSVNPQLLATDEACKTCPGNETIWVNDKSCIPNIIRSKKAVNISQGYVSAPTVTAKPGDQISYTITITNTGLQSASTELSDNLSDVLEYSTLTDNGGGSLNNTTGVISWSDINLKPNESQTRTFIIRILDNIPATAKGSSNQTSYDCTITNTFGNSISINIECPAPKTIEKITSELPKTGPSENLIFACIILALAAYFFARSRQLEKEIRIIRKNTNMGTI